MSSPLGALFSRLALIPDRRHYASPVDFGLPFQDFEVQSPFGYLLRGWRIEPETAMQESIQGSTRETAAPGVVFFAGNSGNLSAHLPYLELLHRAGLKVFAADYAGFGQSGGRARIDRLLEDALAVCEAAQSLSAGGEAPFGPLGVFGLSIGANLALAVAGSRSGVRAVAVEGLSIHRQMVYGITINGLAGPRSHERIYIDGIEQEPRERFTFPGLRGPAPVASALAFLASLTYPFAGKDPAAQAARAAEVPLLAIHGTADRIFPFESAVEVCRRHGPQSRLWLLPGIGHAQEPAMACDEEYAAQLRSFFRTALSAPAPRESFAGPLEFRLASSLGSTWEYEVRRRDFPAAGQAFQVAAIGRECLSIHRLWMEENESRCITLPEEALEFFTLPIHRAERCGEKWRPRLTPRGELFKARFAPLLRALSRALHGRDLIRAGELLRELQGAGPESIFRHIARLHCARLEELARKPLPQISQAAAEIFRSLSSA